jgi:hypothetical protein
MSTRIRLSDACADMLSRTKQPIVTRYQLLSMIASIAHRGAYQGASVYALKREPTESDYRRVIEQLIAEQKLTRDPDFPASVYAINSLAMSSSADICCLADPYCYVSHLSAMEHYSLTDRIPDALIVTRPASALWAKMARQTAERDRGELGSATNGFRDFRPRHYGFPATVRRRPVKAHTTRTPGRSVRERDSFARIARVEQVFCDMLTEPDLCGGMQYVLEVWHDHAGDYFDRIVGAVDQLESSIAKVRAGFILTELMHLTDPTVTGWRRFAQRGSSRLLDPSRSYAPIYSEVWMISLNTELPEHAT